MFSIILFVRLFYIILICLTYFSGDTGSGKSENVKKSVQYVVEIAINLKSGSLENGPVKVSDGFVSSFVLHIPPCVLFLW